ncbi:MAG: GNAT family N-acetyltransferase [Solirubrobacteraceae bacterium]|jgi:GNAT superfamily N-acetyltransferase
MRRELADGFELDDDPARIDVDAVHAFISGESYWGRGRPRERVERAIRGSSRVVGLYRDGEQVGFARAVSDGVIVAYLADVYVLSAYRGRGLGLELVREIVDGGGARGISSDVRWLLHTADAQDLYAKLGFREDAPAYPLMERARMPGTGDRASGPQPE